MQCNAPFSKARRMAYRDRGGGGGRGRNWNSPRNFAYGNGDYPPLPSQINRVISSNQDAPEEDMRRRREIMEKKGEGMDLEVETVNKKPINLDSRKRQAGGKVVENMAYNVAAGGAPTKQPRKASLEPNEVLFEEPVQYVVVANKPGRNTVLMRVDDDEFVGNSVSNPPGFVLFTNRTFIRDYEGNHVAPKNVKIGLLDILLVYGIQIKMSTGTLHQNLSVISTDKNFLRVFHDRENEYKVRAQLAFAMAVTKVREGPTMYIPALIRWVENSGNDAFVHFLAANEEDEQRVRAKACDWVNGLMESRSLGEVYVAVVPEDWVKLATWMALPADIVGRNHDGGLLFRALQMMGPAKREWIQQGMIITDRKDVQQAIYLWEARLLAKHKMIQRSLEFCNTTVGLTAVPPEYFEECRVWLQLRYISTTSETYASWVENLKVGQEILLWTGIGKPLAADIKIVMHDVEGTLTALGIWLEDLEYTRFYDEAIARYGAKEIRISMKLWTGLEAQLKAFRGLNRLPDNGKRMVDAFCGIYQATGKIEPLPPQAFPKLNEGQKRMATLMNQEGWKFPLIPVQAGPGTGKTQASAASANWEANKLGEFEVVVMTATTNLATMNILDALQKVGAMKKVIYLQSSRAEVDHGSLTSGKVWSKARVAERLQELLDGTGPFPFPEADFHFCKQYVERRLPHDGELFQEKKAFGLLMRLKKYKIVVVSLQLLIQMGDVLTKRAMKVYLDEFSLVSSPEFLTAVTGVERELNLIGITSIAVNVDADMVRKKNGKVMEVSTIDAYQGREDDMIVILSTRSSDQTADLDESHVGKAGRVVVAATRARQGMVIIGHMTYLSSLTAWRKYQVAAAEHVPMVDARYVDALEDEMAPTRRGEVWVDQDGKPAFAATFQINKRWKKE
uniref:DNA2/NAM7 helicase-like C-terminal domain-containing protein n=1 Tax=Panagrolaimus davidi TaxID=227884 RepID=A0A914QLZ6_9BILA